jgi:hypothetical protein
MLPPAISVDIDDDGGRRYSEAKRRRRRRRKKSNLIIQFPFFIVNKSRKRVEEWRERREKGKRNGN